MELFAGTTVKHSAFRGSAIVAGGLLQTLPHPERPTFSMRFQTRDWIVNWSGRTLQ
jgi:hypothetical protein